jgi:hypothetical protein
MDMEEEAQEAYEVVKRIDILDVSVGTYTYSFRCFVCDADSWVVEGTEI